MMENKMEKKRAIVRWMDKISTFDHYSKVEKEIRANEFLEKNDLSDIEIDVYFEDLLQKKKDASLKTKNFIIALLTFLLIRISWKDIPWEEIIEILFGK